MTNNEFDKKYLLETDDYKISFYDENKKKIFGNLDDEIDFSKTIMEYKKHFILIDSSTLGHLGVYYIAIQENLFFEQIKELKMNIVFIFLLIYSIITIVGFYLAKLFLKPIKEEREKLNNFIKHFRDDGGFDRLAEKYLPKQKQDFKTMGVPFVF